VFFLALSLFAIGALTIFEAMEGECSIRERLLNLQTFGAILVVRWLLLPFASIHFPVFLLDGRKMPFLLAFVIFTLSMDLGEYLFHRAQHAIPWLWKLHSLHHSDPNMTATTTERHFWGDQILKSLTVWPLAAIAVRPTEAVVLCYVFLSLWNYVAHSSLKMNFGRLSWLINSPAYHRRHHSSDPAHFNSNYAALFPIWDVLSGGYVRPEGFPATGLDYGPKRLREIVAWPFLGQKLDHE
jgi:sterol desaturase/sphingolipid hydroxylase (fatty acid hydroxylase superfamily)